jgi:hypothetical protein
MPQSDVRKNQLTCILSLGGPNKQQVLGAKTCLHHLQKYVRGLYWFHIFKTIFTYLYNNTKRADGGDFYTYSRG